MSKLNIVGGGVFNIETRKNQTRAALPDGTLIRIDGDEEFAADVLAEHLCRCVNADAIINNRETALPLPVMNFSGQKTTSGTQRRFSGEEPLLMPRLLT